VTAHMKAMGLLDSARITSWHLSNSLVYLPAWIIVALVWRSQIWVETNVLLILVVHILLGLTLASWTFFVAAPFGKSPQLAAVCSTFLSILFAIVALILKKRASLSCCLPTRIHIMQSAAAALSFSPSSSRPGSTSSRIARSVGTRITASPQMRSKEIPTTSSSSSP
jgi:hypothetical protein